MLLSSIWSLPEDLGKYPQFQTVSPWRFSGGKKTTNNYEDRKTYSKELNQYKKIYRLPKKNKVFWLDCRGGKWVTHEVGLTLCSCETFSFELKFISICLMQKSYDGLDNVKIMNKFLGYYFFAIYVSNLYIPSQFFIGIIVHLLAFLLLVASISFPKIAASLTWLLLA